MRCRFCGTKISLHSLGRLKDCLQQAFQVSLSEAQQTIAPYGVVVHLSQDSPDKSYFRLVLNDGSIVETHDLEATYAGLLLTHCYVKPAKENEHESEHD